MQFKAVIFDLGDTLILTDRWDYDKCLLRLLRSLRCDNTAVSIPFEEFKRVYFDVRSQMYQEYEASLKEVDFQVRVAETLKRLGCNVDHESPIVMHAVEAFINTFVEDIRMESYTPQLLKKLRAKYKLGLVSNFAYAPGFWRILRRFKLTGFFDAIVVSGELGLRKPHEKIFQEALDKLDANPEDAVFVGDSLKADVNGAKKLGLKTILVENVGVRKNPYAIAGELDPFPVEPDVKIPNLRCLPEALRAL